VVGCCAGKGGWWWRWRRRDRFVYGGASGVV
jgi:hypothetical protein